MRCQRREDTFGFTSKVIFYGTDPTRPIGDWKEAWEKAKVRAATILKGNNGEAKKVAQKTESARPVVQPKDINRSSLSRNRSSAGSMISATPRLRDYWKLASLTLWWLA